MTLLRVAVAFVFQIAFISADQAQQAQSLPELRVIVIGEGSASVTPDYAQIMNGVTPLFRQTQVPLQ